MYSWTYGQHSAPDKERTKANSVLTRVRFFLFAFPSLKYFPPTQVRTKAGRGKRRKGKALWGFTQAEWKKEKHALKRPPLRGNMSGPLLDAVSLFSMQPDRNTSQQKPQEAATFSPFSSHH
ncbi:hypothetical protein ADS79_05855 [Brevibacillus reuszeri]|uniref:Uncharacterized protein n=1 Tax=Brevibacillus reuszeri TaxID=54915 RepID=A0A0K9YXN5_9BACL|nr:hypothetical protein ADS79_05855 [Brevibacillus reuszeri]